MNSDSADSAWPLRSVAFSKLDDATTIAMTVRLSPAERDRLHDLLRSLQDYGLILPPTFTSAPGSFGLQKAVELVRQAVGEHFVDAALSAGGRPGPGSDPDPIAAMPVWAFESERCGSDVMLSSARLWGTDLLLEALRVEGEDDAAPVPAVRARYDRWLAAAGSGRLVRPVRLPRRPGSYALFAAAAPL